MVTSCNPLDTWGTIHPGQHVFAKIHISLSIGSREVLPRFEIIEYFLCLNAVLLRTLAPRSVKVSHRVVHKVSFVSICRRWVD